LELSAFRLTKDKLTAHFRNIRLGLKWVDYNTIIKGSYSLGLTLALSDLRLLGELDTSHGLKIRLGWN